MNQVEQIVRRMAEKRGVALSAGDAAQLRHMLEARYLNSLLDGRAPFAAADNDSAKEAENGATQAS